VERPSEFDYVAGNVKSVLENLEDGQLDSFRYGPSLLPCTLTLHPGSVDAKNPDCA